MAPMSTEQNEERVSAISRQYRQRAEAVAAGAEREREREKAEKATVDKRRAEQHEEPEPVEEPTEAPEEAEDQLPKESWKKDDIIDWLLANGIEAERADLDAQTKAELIENFVDAEG